jgi:hypothetical protein
MLYYFLAQTGPEALPQANIYILEMKSCDLCTSLIWEFCLTELHIEQSKWQLIKLYINYGKYSWKRREWKEK